jgi:hypothetical protein
MFALQAKRFAPAVRDVRAWIGGRERGSKNHDPRSAFSSCLRVSCFAACRSSFASALATVAAAAEPVSGEDSPLGALLALLLLAFFFCAGEFSPTSAATVLWSTPITFAICLFDTFGSAFLMREVLVDALAGQRGFVVNPRRGRSTTAQPNRFLLRLPRLIESTSREVFVDRLSTGRGGNNFLLGYPARRSPDSFGGIAR